MDLKVNNINANTAAVVIKYRDSYGEETDESCGFAWPRSAA